jgi:hypothetical protein
MIILADKSFKTKTQLKIFVSSYLKNNTQIHDTDKIWILKLLERHPRWIDKCHDFKDVFIQKSSSGNNAFYLLKENGDFEDISYLKCIDGEKNKLHVLQALRFEISDFIQKFKRPI